MTNQQRSRFPTAAELRVEIEGWSHLSENMRNELRSAVNLYCRLVGKPKTPALVVMDPAVCLPAMERASAVALGIADKTLANNTSMLRRAFREAGLLAPVRVTQPVEDAAWAPLIAALPARFHPHRLRAFMGYCAAEGIAPAAVSSATLEAYLRHREATHGGKNLRADMQEVARQWNRMRPVCEAWPATEIKLGPAPNRVQALPFSAYPAKLQAEIEAALRPGQAVDLLAEVASGRRPRRKQDHYAGNFSQATQDTRRKGLRLLFWGLVSTGSPPETLTGLRMLIDPAIAARSLQWHRARLAQDPTGLEPTAGLATMADTISWLMAMYRVTGKPREVLRGVLAKCRPKPQREITDKVSAMLEALSVPEARARLLHMPAVLMEEAIRLRTGWTTARGEHRPPAPLEAAWVAALAAAIEILLHLPLRIHDLAALRIGKDFFLEEASRGRWTSRVRVKTNKTNQVVETHFPEESVDLLRRYVEEFRPSGPHPGTEWLFPHRDRSDVPRTRQHFSEAIGAAVERLVGVRVTAHGFRSFVACLIIERDAMAQSDVMAVLGHASVVTALKHYQRINRIAAGQRLSQALRSERKSLPPLRLAKGAGRAAGFAPGAAPFGGTKGARGRA